MLSVELAKYVALQLLILAGSLDEELSKSNQKALPISFSTPVCPSNLPVLTSDLLRRVSSVAVASTGVVVPQPSPVSPTPTGGAQSTHASGGAPVGHQSHSVAVSAPAHGQVVHSSGRRKRSVSGAISESADTLGYVAETVADHPVATVMGVAPVANVVAGLSSIVEEATKPEESILGELILSQ